MVEDVRSPAEPLTLSEKRRNAALARWKNYQKPPPRIPRTKAEKSLACRKAALRFWKNRTPEQRANHGTWLNNFPLDVLSERNRANIKSRWAKLKKEVTAA